MKTDKQAELVAFERLLIIMDELRAKCPWDQKQTFESLRALTIEETYELADAIQQQNLPEIKKEIGDLMLHMAFYAKLGSEIGAFNMAELLHAQCEKLIFRHPHIYSNVTVNSEAEVKKNWEQLKLKEGSKTVLGGVPNALPSLVKAMRIQEKARGIGFDWDNASQVWNKVQEELMEFKAEVEKTDNLRAAEAEFGDLLFSLINYARFVGINPDNALEKTNQKFIQRFNYLEKKVTEAGQQLQDLTLAEMDVYWNEAKAQFG